MDIEHPAIRELPPEEWPALLPQMPHPPKRLYCVGTAPPRQARYLTVVGSRYPSDYGRAAVSRLIGGLRGYPIVIVSGLAIGIDGLAHEAALEAGLRTVAFPGSGLSPETVYPPSNRRLAGRIVAAGGCLISEYCDDQSGFRWIFPRRNRLMAGIAQATLVIEARQKSGSLITAGLAFDYDRSILAVPGSIDSPLSAGPNGLLRDPQAAAIASADDLLAELGFEPRPGGGIAPERLAALDPDSRRLMDEVLSGIDNKDGLCRALGIPMPELNAALSLLELDGLVRTRGNAVRPVL